MPRIPRRQQLEHAHKTVSAKTEPFKNKRPAGSEPIGRAPDVQHNYKAAKTDRLVTRVVSQLLGPHTKTIHWEATGGVRAGAALRDGEIVVRLPHRFVSALEDGELRKKHVPEMGTHITFHLAQALRDNGETTKAQQELESMARQALADAGYADASANAVDVVADAMLALGTTATRNLSFPMLSRFFDACTRGRDDVSKIESALVDFFGARGLTSTFEEDVQRVLIEGISKTPYGAVEITDRIDAIAQKNPIRDRETFDAVCREMLIEDGETSPTLNGKNRFQDAEKSTENYHRAVDWVLERARSGEPPAMDDLFEIHAVCMDGLSIDGREPGAYAGDLRDVNVYAGSREDNVIKQYPEPPLDGYIDQFRDWLDGAQKDVEAKKLSPLIIASTAIRQSVSLHTFVDGNHRAARLFGALLTMSHGYPPGRTGSSSPIGGAGIVAYANGRGMFDRSHGAFAKDYSESAGEKMSQFLVRQETDPAKTEVILKDLFAGVYKRQDWRLERFIEALPTDMLEPLLDHVKDDQIFASVHKVLTRAVEKSWDTEKPEFRTLPKILDHPRLRGASLKKAGKDKGDMLWTLSYAVGNSQQVNIGDTPQARRAFLDDCVSTFQTTKPPPDRGWAIQEDAVRVFGAEGLEWVAAWAVQEGGKYKTWASAMLGGDLSDLPPVSADKTKLTVTIDPSALKKALAATDNPQRQIAIMGALWHLLHVHGDRGACKPTPDYLCEGALAPAAVVEAADRKIEWLTSNLLEADTKTIDIGSTDEARRAFLDALKPHIDARNSPQDYADSTARKALAKDGLKFLLAWSVRMDHPVSGWLRELLDGDVKDLPSLDDQPHQITVEREGY